MPLGGGAIFLKRAGNLVIEDSRVFDCRAYQLGGAIASSGEPANSVTSRRNIFFRNWAGQWGGNIAVYGTLTMLDTHMYEGCARWSAAIYLNAPLQATITGGSILRCYVDDYTTGYGDVRAQLLQMPLATDALVPTSD